MASPGLVNHSRHFALRRNLTKAARELLRQAPIALIGEDGSCRTATYSAIVHGRL